MRFAFHLFVLFFLMTTQAIAQQTPDCASPRTPVLPGNQALDYCQALDHQLREVRTQQAIIIDNLRNGKYAGPPGPPGPAGPQGPQGQPGTENESVVPYLKQMHLRLTAVEERLTQAEYKISSIVNQGNPTGGNDPPESPTNGPSAPPQNTGEGQTTWIEDVLRPIAAVVGNVYAGPVGGALATSILGGCMWLVGRKKKV